MAKLRVLAEKPPMARGTPDNQLRELRDYLFRVHEELEYLLTHLDTDNLDKALNALLDGKQDALTFDAAPAQGSENPATSGGIWDALALKAPAGYGLGEQLNALTAAADCDEVDKTGWFDCPPATLNRPTGITAAYAGMLYSVVRGAQYRYQEYYAPRDKKIFRRFRNENGWEAWAQI